MKFTKKLIACACAALLLVTSAVSMVSCGSKTTSVEDIKAVQDKGKIVIGITEYAPIDYRDENGKWIGFDADFANLFAKELGVECEFLVIDWDNKLMELSSGAIDAIWNGMTIVPEITESCEVSEPYAKNQQVAVMKADAAANYKTIDDMKDLSFAVEAGSSGEAAVKDKVANLTPVTAQSDALLEVASGSSEACVIDGTMAASMTGAGTSYEDLVVVCEVTAENYGVAFRKGSDLCAKFNEVKDKLLADGTLKGLSDTYGVALVD